jgi:hypothetical protein
MAPAAEMTIGRLDEIVEPGEIDRRLLQGYLSTHRQDIPEMKVRLDETIA